MYAPKVSPRRDSNPQPPDPKSDDLSIDLRGLHAQLSLASVPHRLHLHRTISPLSPCTTSPQQQLRRRKINTCNQATKRRWRSRVSIPVPPACEAGALPFELHPPLSMIYTPNSNKYKTHRYSSLLQGVRFCCATSHFTTHEPPYLLLRSTCCMKATSRLLVPRIVRLACDLETDELPWPSG